MAIVIIPPGITPDSTANWGFHALQANVNNYAEFIANITTAGTNTNVTALQALAGFMYLAAGASGGFTLTLPSTTALLTALAPTTPTNGTYAEPIHVVNNNVGQTATLTAGDTNTTLTGTMTVATNTVRKFMFTVTSPTTVTITNVGTWTL